MPLRNIAKTWALPGNGVTVKAIGSSRQRSPGDVKGGNRNADLGFSLVLCYGDGHQHPCRIVSDFDDL